MEHQFNLAALDALQNLTLGTNDVTRWQGTPQVHPYNVSTHAYNCAMLYLQICTVIGHEHSDKLLIALLMHDNMEALTGDLLAPAKDLDPLAWDTIEEQVQANFAAKTGLISPILRQFLPTDENLISGSASEILREREFAELKIIDMLEFLLHALGEYEAGNHHQKVLDGLKYGGLSLKQRLTRAREKFPDDATADFVACVKFYYNRQLTQRGLNDTYYV